MTGRETRKLPALLSRSRGGLNAHGQAGQSRGRAGPAAGLSKHRPSTETTLCAGKARSLTRGVEGDGGWGGRAQPAHTPGQQTLWGVLRAPSWGLGRGRGRETRRPGGGGGRGAPQAGPWRPGGGAGEKRNGPTHLADGLSCREVPSAHHLLLHRVGLAVAKSSSV